MRGALFAIVPRAYHVRLSRVLMNLETIVGGYMRGEAITSVLMATFTFAVLAIARVPRALALAMFAGLADVLPISAPSSRAYQLSLRRFRAEVR